MAGAARSGLKTQFVFTTNRVVARLNGRGGPFGVEDFATARFGIPHPRLNGRGGPFGVEDPVPA